MNRHRILFHALLSFLLVVKSRSACSLSAQELEAKDPNLVEMKYDLGDGEQTYLAYVTPEVSTFYKTNPPSTQPVVPRHKGKGAKFINLSNETVLVYWEPKPNDFETGAAVAIRTVPPFSAKGTSTYPGHSFVFAKDDETIFKRVIVDSSIETIHWYDPYLEQNDDDDGKALKERIDRELSPTNQPLYWQWRNTLRFHKYYYNVTGRTYMARFPRAPPIHFMWPAQHFDQEHWITTRERHFVKALPADAVQLRKMKEDEPVALSDYRTPGEDHLNMTLRVLSCAPRVFEIDNFLSAVEVEHILGIAEATTLDESTLGDEKSKSRRVRTSRNTWVSRSQSAVTDAIYRRAADLMRIDEALMRNRAPTDEMPNIPKGRPYTDKSIAEELQLVHYSVGQEYQTHHDFGFSPLRDVTDSARFATLLLYLNDDLEGGETSFPKFLNAHTFLELKVKPKIGKAVLFYSQLPDGNMDEFSQHKAHIVRQNDKWLINLWVWDPVRVD